MRRIWSLLIPLLVLPAISAAAQSDQPAIRPPDTLNPEQRGNIYMARKMYREAIEQFREMPETAVILNKIGIAYHQLLDLGTAKRYYGRAIKADPKYPEAVNNLGTIYYAARSFGRATREYQRALKLSPDSASILSNLGTAYFARKKYKEAFETYQQALKLDPEVFDHKSSYGVLLQDRSVDERAKFHYYLAKICAQSGLNDKSLNYIRKSLEEGFKETKRYLEEPEFAKVRELPEFQQLMAQQPRAL
jgi:tetratricopeptide (TPR) repeat protein